MALDEDRDVLIADLLALGRALPQRSPGPGLTHSVMARLSHVPVPAASRSRRGVPRRAVDFMVVRRRVVAVVVALLVSLLAAPPVRATLADWFGFAGVVVRHDPSPLPSPAPPPPSAAGSMTFERAKDLVAFQPLLPEALGLPHGVEVSADRRVLSMSWSGGRDDALRLDQFDGSLDPQFAKSAPGAEFVSVGEGFALWFDRPHRVVVLAPDGSRRSETARLAGHTLIWQQGQTTLRLEGDITKARALAIARSAMPRR